MEALFAIFHVDRARPFGENSPIGDTRDIIDIGPHWRRGFFGCKIRIRPKSTDIQPKAWIGTLVALPLISSKILYLLDVKKTKLDFLLGRLKGIFGGRTGYTYTISRNAITSQADSEYSSLFLFCLSSFMVVYSTVNSVMAGLLA